MFPVQSLPLVGIVCELFVIVIVGGSYFALAKLVAKSASFDVSDAMPAAFIVVRIESLDAIIPFISSTVCPLIAIFN